MSRPHPVTRVVRNVLGFGFVLLGIVGLVLPVLQGILFLVIGLSLIDVPQKHRLHRWLSRRLRAYRAVALAHHRVKRRWRRRRARKRAARARVEELGGDGRQ